MKKRLLVSAICLTMAVPALAMAGFDNSAVVTPDGTGSGNTATIDQSDSGSIDNSAVVILGGDNNTASIDQNGTQHSSAEVWQYGNKGTANIFQNVHPTGGNTALIHQFSGSYMDDSTITQDHHTKLSRAHIDNYGGNGNYVNIYQYSTYFPGELLRARAQTDGNSNEIYIDQTGYDNLAVGYTYGNNNLVDINQEGRLNRLNVGVSGGNNNSVLANQYSDESRMRFMVSGNKNNITLLQEMGADGSMIDASVAGNNNVYEAYQFGENNDIIGNIVGNKNEVYVEQLGNNNFADTSLLGNNNDVTIYQ